MFLPNDVIQYTAPRRLLRVLCIERERGIVHVFELGKPYSLPQSVPVHVLTDDVHGGRARLLLQDPCAPPAAPPVLPPKHREVQARAWKIVSSLQAHSPALYDARKRPAMMAACAAEHGVSRASVLRWLRRFWERGQCIDALLPDYANSGARGRTRHANSGVKRGRPRKADGQTGLNVDDATRAIFRMAIARYLAAHPGTGLPRRAAYRKMLDEFYGERAPAEAPSFGQFNYWLEKDSTALPNASTGGWRQGLFVAVQHSSSP
jgi:hypothetical protein